MDNKPFDPIRYVLNKIGWCSIEELIDKDREAAEARLTDLENTIRAIADPDDYETGEIKTLRTCQRLAYECIERNNL